jgi:proline dehydrogenase
MSGTSAQLIRPYYLPLAKWAAQAYVAGPGLADALRVCRWLGQQGVAGTLGFWNGDGDRPRATTDAYLAALDAVARERLHCSLSLKAPALGFSHDLLMEVLERGHQGRLSFQFDALGPETTDQTFSMITRILPRAPVLGCTIPGRWRRSLRDAERAVDLGLNVRVVKGQWADPDDPGLDLREGFLAVVDRLAGRARHVAVATHDPALAREALTRLRSGGTSCELELLFGLPMRRAVRVGCEAQVPVRVYVPYGSAWLPYELSQAWRNSRVLWWFARDLVLGRSGRLIGLSWPAGGLTTEVLNEK